MSDKRTMKLMIQSDRYEEDLYTISIKMTHKGEVLSALTLMNMSVKELKQMRDFITDFLRFVREAR